MSSKLPARCTDVNTQNIVLSLWSQLSEHCPVSVVSTLRTFCLFGTLYCILGTWLSFCGLNTWIIVYSEHGCLFVVSTLGTLSSFCGLNTQNIVLFSGLNTQNIVLWSQHSEYCPILWSPHSEYCPVL